MSKTFAIIVAGGNGSRMGTAIPKQFLALNGKPVLYYSINAFLETFPEVQIILVLPNQYISYAQIVLQSFSDRIDATIISGGETRYHSVQNGLKSIEDWNDDDIIFIHDGVRPLISSDLIKRCHVQAVEKGNAVPAIEATDSMRIIENFTSKPLDRSKIRLIQTPQTFKALILQPAIQQIYQEDFTDEASVVEAFGEKIHLITGEKKNIKITTPEDLLLAEILMNAKLNL